MRFFRSARYSSEPSLQESLLWKPLMSYWYIKSGKKWFSSRPRKILFNRNYLQFSCPDFRVGLWEEIGTNSVKFWHASTFRLRLRFWNLRLLRKTCGCLTMMVGDQGPKIFSKKLPLQQEEQQLCESFRQWWVKRAQKWNDWKLQEN